MASETKYAHNCLIHMTDGLMDIGLLKMVIDAMLFVMIWIVQLVVYPGFCYYKDADLRRWHQAYTWRITVVVMPLMLGQLILYTCSSLALPSAINLGMLSMIILVWVITFTAAVPLHRRIDNGVRVKEASERLVKVNWSRTIIWTIIFITSMLTYGK